MGVDRRFLNRAGVEVDATSQRVGRDYPGDSREHIDGGEGMDLTAWSKIAVEEDKVAVDELRTRMVQRTSVPTSGQRNALQKIEEPQYEKLFLQLVEVVDGGSVYERQKCVYLVVLD